MDIHYPIGLTGGMGSGKSTVSRLLAAHGFIIIDADKITRMAYQDEDVRRRLMAAFGEDIYSFADGTYEVSRHLLAQRAFASDQSRGCLNAIMHPAMYGIARDALARAQGRAILDAPLLFEADWQTLVKSTLAVVCPLEVRLERIRRRDGLDEAQAMARIRAQFDDYPRRADYLIYNVGDIKCLERQVAGIFEEMNPNK